VTATPLGPGPEFDRIRAIAQALGGAAAGLGDDCAFLPGGWCASTDASIEGIHFRFDWLSAEEIGWRATMAALSDLAAVGAEAEAVLVALAVRPGSPNDLPTRLMIGAGEAANAVGARVVGGDLNAGPTTTLAVTVLGRATRPIRRSGAAPGNELWVTGRLGGARAAWQAWEAGGAPSAEARARFAHPIARIAAGRRLATQATAMIDLSDGLAGDAGHLASASGVRVVVDLDRLPIDPAVTAGDPALAAAAGGEDYELLVALPGQVGERLGPELKTALDLDLTRIGVVDSPSAGEVLFLRLGQPVSLEGFNHFR
jgi:thiamine-monophosphate kinase